MKTNDKNHPSAPQINDIDANEHTDHSFTEHYIKDKYWGADYIDTNHSDYNRTISRFFWDDFDA